MPRDVRLVKLSVAQSRQTSFNHDGYRVCVYGPIEQSPEDLGRLGLTEALERLRTRVGNAETGNPIVSLGEALWWLAALEKHYVDTLGSRAFYDARKNDPGGEIEAGLVFARNLFAHGLEASAALVQWRNPRHVTKGPWPGSWARTPWSSTGYRWKALKELPVAGKPEKHGRDELYRLRVEGQPMMPPLEAAVAFMMGLGS